MWSAVQPMSCEIKEGDFDPVLMVKAMTIGAICEGISDASI